MDQQLEAFVGEIVDKKQLDGVDSEVRAQLVEDLTARLFDQINRALLAALPDDKMSELESLIDSGADEAAVQQFIVNAGVNVQQITVGVMVAFRNLYLGEKVE